MVDLLERADADATSEPARDADDEVLTRLPLLALICVVLDPVPKRADMDVGSVVAVPAETAEAVRGRELRILRVRVRGGGLASCDGLPVGPFTDDLEFERLVRSVADKVCVCVGGSTGVGVLAGAFLLAAPRIALRDSI